MTVWLQSSLRKQAVADLQQQILEAGRLGNTALLMELMQLKQDLERKRMGL